MWKAITMFSILACAAQSASAAGYGYGFFGPGRSPDGDTVGQFGGGGEAFLYKGLGVGGEASWAWQWNGFVYGIGLLSANGSYHFNRSRDSKVMPFVTGGYTMAVRGDHVNLANVGGGVTWWASRRAGLRLEVRDYLWPEYRVQHMPMVRFSVTFR